MPQATPMPDSVLPQRGMEGMIGAIFAGLCSGGLAWLSLRFGASYPLLLGFVLVVPIPLFAAGLGIGRSDMLVAAAVALASMTYLLNIQTMGVLAVVFVLPAMMICLLALRYRQDETGKLFWYPAGRLITALVMYPLAVLAGLMLLFHETGLQKILFDIMYPMMEDLMKLPQARQASQALPGGMTPELLRQATHSVTLLLPGLTIVSWISTILVCALWVQFTLMSNKYALRPPPSLNEYDLPGWLLIFFAIMALLAMGFEGKIAFFAQNTLLPLTVPYFMLGSSLVHAWADKSKHKILILILFYLFVLAAGWPLIIVAMAGVLEPWLHLRRKILGKPKANL